MPATKARHLSVVRAFFHDCQAWGRIPRRFHPDRAFELPRSVRNLTGPNPRVLADDAWAKLLWAGLNLTRSDVGQATWRNGGDRSGLFYPLEMVRALAVVWLFAGLRSDEIRRLRVGTVRWQREDVQLAGSDDILRKDSVCFIDIPGQQNVPAVYQAGR